MSNIEQIHVPDIGDFSDVDIIEVLVSPGQTIARDDPLITLESDKASMEIPSPEDGVVQEILVKVGDNVSKGDTILTLQVESAEVPTPAEAEQPETPPETPPAPAPAPAESLSGGADVECQVVVLGSGPGGYTAAFRAADLGQKTVLIERYPTLGGVCLNVGCIPSKALLHAAKVIDETRDFSKHGLKFSEPDIELDGLRDWKDGVVKRLTGGLTGLAKQRKVTVLRGYGKFIDSHHIRVEDGDGKVTAVKFEKCIIAAGSQPVKLPFIPEDPRIVDSTGALELRRIPKKMLVLGGGIIGLEMATVYYALGARISVVEMLEGLMMGADRDIVKPFQKRMESRYEKIMLKTRVTQVEALDEGIRVSFEGDNAPPEPELYDMVLVSVGRAPNGKKIDAEKAGVYVDERGFIPADNQLRTNVGHIHAMPEFYDMVLVSVGRVPNGKKLDAEKAGVSVDERGFIPADKQLRTNVGHIHAIGDIIGQPMLAHKAVHEGKTAAEVCAGHRAYFDARVIPSVAYTDPEVAWVGMTEEEAKKAGVKYGKGVFPWAASGRSLAIGRDEGITKVIFDEDSHRVIGVGIVGPSAGDLISEGVLAIEMGCDASDIGMTIHPHPTLSETLCMAAEAFEGTLTDLYIPKKRRA